MILENSSVFREILEIFGDKAKPINQYWEAEIHVAGQTISAYRVTEIQIIRDYIRTGAESVIVELDLPSGDYTHTIVPNKDNIELTLICRPIYELNEDSKQKEDARTQRFVAVLRQKDNPAVEGSNPSSMTAEKGNQLDIASAEFELLDYTVEQVRNKSLGMPLRNCTAADAIRAILGIATQGIKVEKEIACRGVDIAPNANDKVREHVLVPHHMEVLKIPRYIHENCGGVFSTGFGSFFQRGIWYVYGPYDLSKFATTKGKNPLS